MILRLLICLLFPVSSRKFLLLTAPPLKRYCSSFLHLSMLHCGKEYWSCARLKEKSERLSVPKFFPSFMLNFTLARSLKCIPLEQQSAINTGQSLVNYSKPSSSVSSFSDCSMRMLRSASSSYEVLVPGKTSTVSWKDWWYANFLAKAKTTQEL